MDYKTPKDLADYLIYLSENKTAYNEYFKWKKYASYHHRMYKNHNFCTMCIKLHLQSIHGIQHESLNLTKLFSPVYNCVQVDGRNKITPYNI